MVCVVVEKGSVEEVGACSFIVEQHNAASGKRKGVLKGRGGYEEVGVRVEDNHGISVGRVVLKLAV